MLKIEKHMLNKYAAAILEGVQPDNTPEEDQIMDFIRNAVRTMPQQPEVRWTGGWIKLKEKYYAN